MSKILSGYKGASGCNIILCRKREKMMKDKWLPEEKSQAVGCRIVTNMLYYDVKVIILFAPDIIR